MKNMLRKLLKRLLIQFIFFLVQNPLLGNFASGSIYQGNLKAFCSPGLNCYSCPAAVMACPIGAIQLFFAGARQSISLYVSGLLISVGAVFGRLVCGYVCPMGLLQDLMYKLKTPKLITKLKYARYLKYAVLIVFVILLPLTIRDELSGLGASWFCKYICPSGTIFGAVPLLVANDFLRSFAGALFAFKAVVAVSLLVAETFIYRFFCRVVCPLGAIYSLFNKISLVKMRCDPEKCVSCGKCEKACKLRIQPAKEPNSPECVRCGDCTKACGAKALRVGVR